MKNLSTRLSVSVVLPNYNHAAFLPRALDAILEQMEPQDELVLVDDASTDNSVEVAKSYAVRHPNLRVHCLESNLGVVAAMEEGFRRVTGELVYFAAADDIILRGFFEKAVRMLELHPTAGFCCADDVSIQEPSGRRVERRLGFSSVAAFWSAEEARLLAGERDQFVVPGVSTVYRRSVLGDGKIFEGKLLWHVDVFLSKVIAFRHGFCYLPEILVSFTSHPESFSGKGISEAAQRKRVVDAYLSLATSAKYEDVLDGLMLPSCLNFYRGATSYFTRRLLRRVRYWKFLRKELVFYSLRDFMRKKVWQFLWILVSPLGMGSNWLKLGVMKFFGATLHGSCRVGAYVKMDAPWNLEIGHGVVIGEESALWSKDSKIIIHDGVLLEKGVRLSASGWDEENGVPTWRAMPVVVGKDAFLGVSVAVLPGVSIADGAVIGAGETVRK